MKPAAMLTTGLAGILIWGVALVHVGRQVEDRTPKTETAAAPVTAPAVAPVLAEEPALRSVSPDLFASPLTEGVTMLERIESRAPLSEPLAKPPEPLRLARPQTLDAGVIQSGDRRVRLAGIATTSNKMICFGGGAPWPCGVVARTQQRLLLRNRTVECDIVDDGWTGERVASCNVGGVEIGRWLAESGWVKAEKGSPFAELTEAARLARKGLFGNDPRQ